MTSSPFCNSLVVQMAASVSEDLRRFVFDSPAVAIAAKVHGAKRLYYFLDQKEL